MNPLNKMIQLSYDLGGAGPRSLLGMWITLRLVTTLGPFDHFRVNKPPLAFGLYYQFKDKILVDIYSDGVLQV